MQVDDQGLVNTDPRYIAVPNAWVNLIPTNVNGLTFSRTPQMVRAYSCVIVSLLHPILCCGPLEMCKYQRKLSRLSLAVLRSGDACISMRQEELVGRKCLSRLCAA
jgi:hypothetical protein